MNATWTPKSLKISTLLTSTTIRRPADEQREVIAEWSKVIPRIISLGPVEPIKSPGVRWINSSETAPFRNLIGAYMFQIPAGEVCALASPEFLISKDQSSLFKYVNSNRLGLAWAAHADREDGSPGLFVMSASVIAFIMRELPNDMTMAGGAWSRWLHGWLSRHMMPPRYVDATAMGLISKVPSSAEAPVLNAYSLPDGILDTAKSPPQRKKKKTA